MTDKVTPNAKNMLRRNGGTGNTTTVNTISSNSGIFRPF